MKEALMGIETEYGIHCNIARLHGLLGSNENYATLALKQVGLLLPEDDYFVCSFRTPEFWTRAGMRLYRDTGDHIEAATSECGTFEELIFQKNVADCLVAALVGKAREFLRGHPYNYDGLFEVYANNTAIDFDGHGSKSEISFGRHENYLLRRDLILKSLGPQFHFDFILENCGYFFAARPLLGGSGHINPEGNFILSPRSEWVKQEMGGATTSSRALVNTRDEPHAECEKFLRYHHTAGDTNITDNITRMKMAFTYWVLRLLELGWRAPNWLVIEKRELSKYDENLMVVKWGINNNPFLDKVYVVGGKRVSAADILIFYLEEVDKYRKELRFEAEDDEIFQDVSSYLKRAQTGSKALFGESEWATKHILMLRKMGKKVKSFSHPVLKKLSLVLHDLNRNPEQNLFLGFRNKVLPPNIEISDLVKACRRAPKTRAFVRGLGFYLANKLGAAITTNSGNDWASVSTVAPRGKDSTSYLFNKEKPWQVTKADICGIVKFVKLAAIECPKDKSSSGYISLPDQSCAG
ncbi:MAG: proteasome accessory factor PafA2 family protein [bacterium]|nr:proteasome accessory factor PafA2 family protein [bacterium]